MLLDLHGNLLVEATDMITDFSTQFRERVMRIRNHFKKEKGNLRSLKAGPLRMVVSSKVSEGKQRGKVVLKKKSVVGIYLK